MRLTLVISVVILAAITCTSSLAQTTTAPAEPVWDLKAWEKPAKVYPPPPGYEQPDVRALMYEGVPYQGKPTRVFAWYGAPKTKPGEKVPAIVLVHGGGGTAFIEWVRMWNKRGYAAISMDTRGFLPPGKGTPAKRHDMGGPEDSSVFGGIDQPAGDQWPYHAASAAILAHSLIRSFPEVDADRIGITGISWGGFVTGIVVGLDHRLKFAVPVYGCGFIADNSAWLDDFTKMGPEKTARWVKWWDPSQYLPKSDLPMLWLNGSNDFAYPLPSWQKSYRLGRGERRICLKLNMPHRHAGLAEQSEEIHAFADWHVKGGPPLAKVSAQGRDGANVWAEYVSPSPIVSAELIYTHNQGVWRFFKYASIPAAVDEKAHKVAAQLPAGTRVYYLNLTDANGLIVSTEHEVLAEPVKP